MRTLREVIGGGSITITERKSVVGALGNPGVNIYKDKIMTPHQIMEEIEIAYGNNPIFRSAAETVTDFIYGGDIVFKSDDKMTEVRGNQLVKDLKFGEWVPQAIRETIKSGNGWVEMDYNPITGLPQKFYAQAISSRWYINAGDHGGPKMIKKLVQDQTTGLFEYKEVPNTEEYYIQQIDPGINYKGAKWYNLSYHVAGTGKFRLFKIYGIPIHKDKMIHFKLNLGTTGLYGNSHFASALDDNEILKDMERSLAVISRYKAVPRKIIMYGDKDVPATGEELDDFIIYLESLERDEDPVVNKPIKIDDLSYAGGDINLSYMIEHIRKKLFGGVVPDFLTGYGDQVNRATAQVQLVSFVLSIYSKRQIFLKILEEKIINPWLKHEKLKQGHLEFNELDFETKGEKSGRVLQLWSSNLLTLNRSREILGENKLGDEGDVYYTEWQNKLMVKGMPGQGQSPDEFGLEQPQDVEQTPYQFLQDTATPPPQDYSIYSQGFKESCYHSELEGKLYFKEGLGTTSLGSEEGMVKDPSGLDPLVSRTALYIRTKFIEKLEQVKKFSSKKSLEILKEDLKAKDVRELAMFLRVGKGDIKEGVEQAIEQAWLKGSQDAGRKIGLHAGIPTSVRNMNAIKKRSWGYVAKNLEKGTEKIEDALYTGIIGRKKGKALEREVESAYGFISWKSEQLAVTELRKAHSAGMKYVMEKSPYKNWKWITSLDEKTCPFCRPKHGRVFDVRNKLEYFPPLHPNCFISPLIPILTDKGYKRIKDIAVGNKVLTHDGTFKKVKKLIDKKTYKGEVYTVSVGREKLTTTPEHPYLVLRNGKEVWVTTEKLKKGDKLKVLAKRCEKCNELFPFTYGNNSSNFCGLSCANSHSAIEQWKNPKNRKVVSKKVSEWNNRRYKENPELKFSVTKKANKKTRQMVLEGTHPLQKKNRSFLSWTENKGSKKYKEICEKISWWKRKDGGNQAILGKNGWTDETYKKVGEKNRKWMLAGGGARMCSKNRNPSKPQVKLYNKIKKKYQDAILNHPVKINDKKYFVMDIFVPSTKTNYEYDGLYWHKDRKKEDTERDYLLNKQGINVIRFGEGDNFEV